MSQFPCLPHITPPFPKLQLWLLSTRTRSGAFVLNTWCLRGYRATLLCFLSAGTCLPCSASSAIVGTANGELSKLWNSTMKPTPWGASIQHGCIFPKYVSIAEAFPWVSGVLGGDGMECGLVKGCFRPQRPSLQPGLSSLGPTVMTEVTLWWQKEQVREGSASFWGQEPCSLEPHHFYLVRWQAEGIYCATMKSASCVPSHVSHLTIFVVFLYKGYHLAGGHRPAYALGKHLSVCTSSVLNLHWSGVPRSTLCFSLA